MRESLIAREYTQQFGIRYLTYLDCSQQELPES